MADKIINWMSVNDILPNVSENTNESEPVLINMLFDMYGHHAKMVNIGKLCLVKRPTRSDSMLAWYADGNPVPEWYKVTHWMPIPELPE